MDKTIPRLPAGFKEYLPNEQKAFDILSDKIESVYKKYGFQNLDTPVLEYSEVLLAKAGGETEQQIYRFSKGDNDLCMRFDMTVPLARYVSEHERSLVFPFKRYQNQKAWRAESPQKGRFREFFQCDADIVGSHNVINDAELMVMIDDVFCNLNIGKIRIRINHRKILTGLLQSLGLEDKNKDVLRLIDKISKIRHDQFIIELETLGLNSNQIEKIQEIVYLEGDNAKKFQTLKNCDAYNNDTFKNGLSELEQIFTYIKSFGLNTENVIDFDLKIARGLDYYTGLVFETNFVEYPQLGSICSGGRYDNLTTYYSDKDMPGVGISIGTSRMFDQLVSEGIIDVNAIDNDEIVLAFVDDDSRQKAMQFATILRAKGKKVTALWDADKLGKQLNYANKLKVPKCLIFGMEEAGEHQVIAKDLTSGTQEVVNLDEI